MSHSDDGVSQNENKTSLDNTRQVEVHKHRFRWSTEANIIFISAATTFLQDKCHSKVKSHNEFWRNFADQPNLPHQIKGHNGKYYYYHYYLLCKVAKPYEKEITGTNHRGAAPDLYSDVIYFKDLFTEATQKYYEENQPKKTKHQLDLEKAGTRQKWDNRVISKSMGIFSNDDHDKKSQKRKLPDDVIQENPFKTLENVIEHGLQTNPDFVEFKDHILKKDQDLVEIKDMTELLLQHIMKIGWDLVELKEQAKTWNLI